MLIRDIKLIKRIEWKQRTLQFHRFKQHSMGFFSYLNNNCTLRVEIGYKNENICSISTSMSTRRLLFVLRNVDSINLCLFSFIHFGVVTTHTAFSLRPRRYLPLISTNSVNSKCSINYSQQTKDRKWASTFYAFCAMIHIMKIIKITLWFASFERQNNHWHRDSLLHSIDS